MMKKDNIIAKIMIIIFAINILNPICIKAETRQTDPIIIVSLGDSYSSREGIPPFYGQDENRTSNIDWLAHRSTKSWPSLLTVPGLDGSLSEFKDENWFFVAASGATLESLTDFQKKTYDRDGNKGEYLLDPQLNIFDTFEENTVDYVTITIGGNDVGFSNIITMAAGSSLSANSSKLTNTLNGIWNEFNLYGGTRDQLKDAYIAVAEAAGDNANIIIAGYPKLLDEDGNLLFSSEDSAEINSSVSNFNDELSNLVNECRSEGVNIYFVSVEEEFEGHEAYSDDAYINSVIFPSQDQDLADSLTSAYSMHPNEKGAEVYAACVQETINIIEAGTIKVAETTEETSEEDSFLSEITTQMEEKVQGMVDQIVEDLTEKLEKWFDQWFAENCENC